MADQTAARAGASNLGKKGIVLLGVVGVSFSAILVKWSQAPSMVLVFYRVLLAALVMTVPCLVQLKKEYRSWGRRELLCCLVSGFFLSLHFTAYFEAIRYTSIASSVVLVDTEVFFVAFIMLIFFKEKISARGWLGILLTFAGSVIIAAGDAGGGSDVIRGDLYAISGAAFMSIYTIMGKFCRQKMSTTVYTTLVYWVASLSMVVMLTAQGLPCFGYGAKEVLIGFGMAVLCTLLGHSVFSWGLKYVPASFISTVKLMEPVFASLFAIPIFGQIPSVTAVAGGLIIIFGIACYSRHSG